MRLAPRVFADPATMGEAAAALVLDRLDRAPRSRPFVLGCPGGRSPLPTYAALARQASAGGHDLSRCVIAMMDEYLVDGPDGTLVAETPAALHSCRRFGRTEIVERLNAGLPPAHRIRPAHLWVPDPADPDAYERRLDGALGVDVFLLASGASDGHIAFNPPGTAPDARTRVVALPESTRRDNLQTFPSFGGDLSAVPAHGVTVGVATIREVSREVVMLVHGAHKRAAAAQLRDAAHYDPAWPATVVAECRSPHLFVDADALGATEHSPPPPDQKV